MQIYSLFCGFEDYIYIIGIILEMNFYKYSFSIPKRVVLSSVFKDSSSDNRRVFLRAKSNILWYVRLILIELMNFKDNFDQSQELI